MARLIHVFAILPLLIPVLNMGCQKISPGSAEAYVRVLREGYDGTNSDYMIYKDTQAALLKSTFVINTALADDDVGAIQNANLKEIRKALWVAVSEDELLLVRLNQSTWTPEETESILNAVLQAYESKVIGKERLKKVEQLAKLRKRYQSVYDSISESTEAVNSLAKRLGSTEAVSANDTIELMSEISQEHILNLKKHLTELQLKQVALSQGSNNDKLVAARFEVSQLKMQLEEQEEASPVEGEVDEIVDVEDAEAQKAAVAHDDAKPGQEGKRFNKTDELKRELALAVKRVAFEEAINASSIEEMHRIWEEQIQLLKEQIATETGKLEQFAPASGELQARLDLLAGMRTDLQVIHAAKSKLEIEIESGERIQIIQNAVFRK